MTSSRKYKSWANDCKPHPGPYESGVVLCELSHQRLLPLAFPQVLYFYNGGDPNEDNIQLIFDIYTQLHEMGLKLGDGNTRDPELTYLKNISGPVAKNATNQTLIE